MNALLNDFAALSREDSLSAMAQVQFNETETPVERTRVNIRFEDHGDDDAAWWLQVIYNAETGEELHCEPISKHGGSRNAAYEAAATWANGNNFLIESR